MTPEPYTVDLDPDTKTTLKIYLFKNVNNVEAIRQQVMKGEWRCAVVKPSLVVDPLQVAVAANRAAVARSHARLVTRTLFAEILYNLSLTKNISQSLSKFGIEKDNNLLVCFMITGEEDTTTEILAQIEGEQCPISELSSMTNVKDVKSAYKLNNMKGDVDILDVIISRMVTKNFVSH